jgi:hypothetical protein
MEEEEKSHEHHGRSHCHENGGAAGYEERQHTHHDEWKAGAECRTSRPWRALLREGVTAVSASRRTLAHTTLAAGAGLFGHCRLSGLPTSFHGRCRFADAANLGMDDEERPEAGDLG